MPNGFGHEIRQTDQVRRQKAIDSKCTVPILEGVLIELNGTLTLTEADQRFAITTTITEYEEHEAGSVVIPAKKVISKDKSMEGFVGSG